jgi:hypothetical protein
MTPIASCGAGTSRALRVARPGTSNPPQWEDAMSTKKSFTILALAALAAMVLVLYSGSAAAVNAVSFSRQGNFSSNWYWMTRPGMTNTWTFSAPAKSEVKSFTSCELWFDALVTNDTSGGSGHSKVVNQYLTVRSGSASASFPIKLENRYRPITLTNSRGVGYPVDRVFVGPELSKTEKDALQKVCDNFMAAKYDKVAQPLVVSYVWQPTAEPCCAGKSPAPPHHVAVNQASMQVYFSK